MAISGQQVILVGLPNQVEGSDSLYNAFNKVNQNFTTLFANSSPSLAAGNGITLTPNPVNGTISVINSGIRDIVAGTNITVVNNNGVATISSTGSGNGVLNSVGILSNTLSVANSPLTNNGNITVNLANTGVAPGNYPIANVTVDSYGRIIAIAAGFAVGTVTSVGLTPGTGIAIAGGPITSSGTISVTNTGVTQLTAGTGINLTGNTGAITVSATNTGTVTSVGVTSTTLTVTGSPITTTGSISVDLPNAVVKWRTVPVSNTSPGVAGEAAYDSGGNLYVCVATNTWAKFIGNTSW